MLSVYRESEIAPFCRFAVGAFSVSSETEGTIMGISKKFTIVFVALLVCALFACALVACNPSDSANNGQLPSDEEYVTVTFDTDGGSAVQAEKVKVGDRVEKPAEPLKDGYLFAGWFLDGKQYDFNLSVTSDITLVAHWTENMITVMFVVNDTVIKQLNVKYGSSLQSDDIPAVPERSGYIGAWDRQSFDNLKESLTVKAVYTRQEYDVRFVLNYEGAGTVTERTENGLITFIPERPDYVFNGWWYSDGQTIDGGYILTRRHDMKETIDEAGVVLYAEWVKEADRAEQLSAPVVSVENGVFYWEAVDGATGYTVTILQGSVEQEKSRITATHFSFPTYYSAGYYTVKICANGDGINTYNSVETSKNYAHRILTQPTNVNINDTTSVLTWTAVPNATSYTVTVNGTAVNCSDPVYDMSSYEAGTYTVTVTAKRNGWTSAETRATIKKVRLKTPAVSITTDGLMYTVTWDEVAHANSYIVKIGEKETNTASASWTISRTDASLWGTTEELTLIVYAYDTNTEYLRSIGEEYSLTRLWTLILETVGGGQVNAVLGLHRDCGAAQPRGRHFSDVHGRHVRGDADAQSAHDARHDKPAEAVRHARPDGRDGEEQRRQQQHALAPVAVAPGAREQGARQAAHQRADNVHRPFEDHIAQFQLDGAHGNDVAAGAAAELTAQAGGAGLVAADFLDAVEQL